MVSTQKTNGRSNNSSGDDGDEERQAQVLRANLFRMSFADASLEELIENKRLTTPASLSTSTSNLSEKNKNKTVLAVIMNK